MSTTPAVPAWCRLGSLSRRTICIDATLDRRELTLLDRREDTEALFGRVLGPLQPPRRLNVPLRAPPVPPPPALGEADTPPTAEEELGEAMLIGAGTAAFRLPFRSSLNHMRKVVRMLLRFRIGPPVSLVCWSLAMPKSFEFPGELAGVGAAANVDERETGTQGDALGRPVGIVCSFSGVAGGMSGGGGVWLSFTGRKGGDLVSLFPSPCPFP